MAPEERKIAGAELNKLKDKVAGDIEARRTALREIALDARLKTETVDVTLPVAPGGRRHASIR